ncbi:MAG: hypothetical protein HY323_09295 [Betaproteobacteria bacterium]|nr:hypothetical protein [Betaproteobacteria bacterium]
MKKEIRQVDASRGIVQVTVCDERFYARPTVNPVTGIPEGYEYVPSATWICSHYPKGVGFWKWLASTGWDEAEAIKQAAGDKGSKVHQAIGDLLAGKTIPMDAPYLNRTTGQPEPLSLEEYECLLSFKNWWATAKPEFVASEFVLWGDGYAGTGDLFCKIDGQPWLIDVKTSQYVWPEHELQVSAYRHALPEEWDSPLAPPKLGILQVGYRRNERRWKLTEVADQFDLFLSAKTIWAKETAGQEPFKRDYPLEISLIGESEVPLEEPSKKSRRVTAVRG